MRGSPATLVIESVDIFNWAAGFDLIEALQKPIIDPVHPTVEGWATLLVPRPLNDVSLHQILQLLVYVDLYQFVCLLIERPRVSDDLLILVVGVFNLPEPLVEHSVSVRRQRRFNAAASVVPAHDDMLDLEVLHREGEDAQEVEVGMVYEVRDVSVGENLTWGYPRDLLGWNSTIGASDPKKLRPLLPGHIFEEIRG